MTYSWLMVLKLNGQSFQFSSQSKKILCDYYNKCHRTSVGLYKDSERILVFRAIMTSVRFTLAVNSHI